jgi:alpha-glucosidase
LRSAFQLRYAMQPYIYTEARKTYDTGVGFLRPLYYDWPEANEAYTSKNEYVFGDQMLVAPVVAPADKTSGLASEHVWLPQGEWFEWQSGKHFTGPTTTDRSFSIEQTPVYVKAGAIIPMQPPMLYTGQKPVDPLIVNVWPLKPGTTSSYSVYEDSGVAEDYQRGVFDHTPIKATQTGDTLRVEIGPVEGAYPGMLKTRAYELRLPADWPPESVTVNGVPVKRADATGKGGWSFEGNALTTVLPIASSSVESRTSIEVHRAAGLTARRDDLDGFAGTMTRLHSVYDELQKTWPVAGPPDSLIDVMQTGDRLGYHPENAKAEIEHFRLTLIDAQQAVERLQTGFAQRLDDFTKRMSQDSTRGVDLDAQKKNRMDSVARAVQQIQSADR